MEKASTLNFNSWSDHDETKVYQNPLDTCLGFFVGGPLVSEIWIFENSDGRFFFVCSCFLALKKCLKHYYQRFSLFLVFFEIFKWLLMFFKIFEMLMIRPTYKEAGTRVWGILITFCFIMVRSRFESQGWGHHLVNLFFVFFFISFNFFELLWFLSEHAAKIWKNWDKILKKFRDML